MSVSITTVRALVAELTHRGVAHQALFEAAQVPVDVLSDPQARIDRVAYHHIVQLAFERTGDLSLGLTAGMRTPITALSVVGPMMLSANTLRDAFTSFQRYLPLLAPGAEWDLREAQDVAVISYVPAYPRGAGTRFCAEYSLALASRVGRGGALGKDTSKHGAEVWFSHSAPSNTEPYRRFFGCPVHFRASETAIVMPRARIDRPLMHADPFMKRAFEQTAERYLTAVQGSQVDARVRAYLRGQSELSGLTSAVVAVRLNFSPRTFRRHLEVLGTSFSQILDEVRTERALEELAMPHHALKAVASRLGFTVPAFHRAFRRWTGQTPATYARAREAERGATTTARRVAV